MSFNKDALSITAYRSIDTTEQSWMITSPLDNHSENAPFGGLVLEFLNALRSILHRSEEQSKYDEKMIGLLRDNSKYWEGSFYELIDAILAKDNLEQIERYRIYERFKSFSLEIVDYQFLVARDKKFDEYRKQVESNIIFKGYEILKNKKQYEVFTMPNSAYFFALDLWNIFFQENLNLKFKCCAYCNDYIGIHHGSKKYCPICKEISKKESKKKSNIKLMSNAIEYTKKRIVQRFAISQKYANESEERISAFLGETGYIEARLRGEERQYNPNYDNIIQTEEQYLKWLIKYEDCYRIYKKPNTLTDSL